MPSNASSSAAEWVAVLADVHGNATALEAVLHELARERSDVLVHCGDLTWGPQPRDTIRLLDEWEGPVLFVRGNADRRIVELAAEPHVETASRAAWMVDAHEARDRDRLSAFAESVALQVEGLGTVRFCHGSPRSDIELITRATPRRGWLLRSAASTRT
ncbi:MAG: metallophosphoesterase [Gaiellaceae bacterium MAG52_C11]|nr:metallophosphoesterase [Candidatus Gaiellasilicea maunaloa]